MATLNWYSNSVQINIGTSGIGYFNTAFGESIPVASYNGKSYMTNSAGTDQGAELNNIKWLNTASGIVGAGGSGIPLTSVPNAQASFNLNFQHTSAVRVQNWKFRTFDRTHINNDPSGITVRAAELIHPGVTQINSGSGDATWSSIFGSGSVLDLAQSPGASGHYAGNGSTSVRSDTHHDAYVAVSVTPDSVGAKTFAFYSSLEYL